MYSINGIPICMLLLLVLLCHLHIPFWQLHLMPMSTIQRVLLCLGLLKSQAAANSDFMLRREPDGRLCLNVYTSQIQGQMAIGGQNWCDFIVYTSKGIYVQRIKFDLWESELLPKLCSFYSLCLGPEIVCPLGSPIRDFRSE